MLQQGKFELLLMAGFLLEGWALENAFRIDAPAFLFFGWGKFFRDHGEDAPKEVRNSFKGF